MVVTGVGVRSYLVVRGLARGDRISVSKVGWLGVRVNGWGLGLGLGLGCEGSFGW